MHYVISYDIENDRLREKTAKLLAKHGCERVQKSVFVAPYMERNQLLLLDAALRKLLARQLPGGGGNLLILPLREEYVAEIRVLGDNNILPYFDPPPLKIRL